MADEPQVLDRVMTPRGELVLRRLGDDFELISNGVFLMDTRDGRSERALVREAVRRHPAPRRLLIGGLGVGFSLLEALEHPEVEQVVVVEIEQALVDWHATYLRERTGSALADPRVQVVVADVSDHLTASPAGYDAISLDVDNGPDWTVSVENTGLYGEAGITVCAGALAPGGVLAVWSAAPAPHYEQLLRQQLDDVQVVEIPAYVERSAPDVIFLGRRPRAA